MNRLDLLLATYEKERQQCKTLQEFQKANRQLVKKIEALPGNKTQTEQMVLALLKGMG